MVLKDVLQARNGECRTIQWTGLGSRATACSEPCELGTLGRGCQICAFPVGPNSRQPDWGASAFGQRAVGAALLLNLCGAVESDGIPISPKSPQAELLASCLSEGGPFHAVGVCLSLFLHLSTQQT